MTKTQLLRQFKKHVATIAKERDAMRALLREYEDVLYTADDAMDQMERALDTLSQYL